MPLLLLDDDIPQAQAARKHQQGDDREAHGLKLIGDAIGRRRE